MKMATSWCFAEHQLPAASPAYGLTIGLGSHNATSGMPGVVVCWKKQWLLTSP